jgi:hypothetical protein
MTRRKHLRLAASTATLALLVLIQLVPVDRENPPVQSSIPAPPEVEEILRRACFDCHSNDTRWPWYGYVAPVSWLITHDVSEGRYALNFSEWDDYDEEEQLDLIERVAEEAEEARMPPSIYLPLHEEARLSREEVDRLIHWAEEAGLE